MSKEGKTTPELDVESLFLLGGGRFSQRLERLQLAKGSHLRAGRMAALLAAATWLPLLFLAAVEGVAWTDRVSVPLLNDFLPYGQFLVAVPVLVLGEVAVGRRLGWAVAELRRSDILAPEDTPALDELLAHAVAWWRGWTLNAVLLLVTCAATSLSFVGAQEWLTGGWQYVGERVTLPGWWYLLISLPVMRFLALRWLWRLFLWAWILWRASRLRLQPRPTHSDRAGGLAFLGATQAAFGVLVFALGIQLSCLVADAVSYRSAELMAYRAQVTAFVLIAVTSFLLPLLPFAPKLVRARRESLVSLSGSGYQGAEHLDRQLRDKRTGELPSDEISGLADFGALYENALKMSPLPVELRDVLFMALAAVLPFVPLVFLVMPAQDVFRTLAKLLI